MPTPSTRPRILFVSPEAVFRPEDGYNRAYSTNVNGGNLDSFPAELIGNMFESGANVYLGKNFLFESIDRAIEYPLCDVFQHIAKNDKIKQ